MARKDDILEEKFAYINEIFPNNLENLIRYGQWLTYCGQLLALYYVGYIDITLAKDDKHIDDILN